MAVLPPEGDACWNSEGAGAHAFHVTNAVLIALDCLKEKGVDSLVARADVVEVESPFGSITLRAKQELPHGFGVYLLRSGAAPKPLACSAGTSGLQVVVPVVAAEFFGYLECIPEEWRDRDGGEKC